MNYVLDDFYKMIDFDRIIETKMNHIWYKQGGSVPVRTTPTLNPPLSIASMLLSQIELWSFLQGGKYEVRGRSSDPLK